MMENDTYYLTIDEDQKEKYYSTCFNLIINVITPLNREHGFDITNSPLTPYKTGALANLYVNGILTHKEVKDMMELIIENPESDVVELVEKYKMQNAISFPDIDTVIDKLVSDNPDKLEQLKEKPKIIGWFIGQVMKATNGKANPVYVNDKIVGIINDEGSV